MPKAQVHKLTISYDGTPFYGWQKQRDKPSIQQKIEAALEVCWKKQIFLAGSGRTDTGVHALGQVAHFTAEKKWPAPIVVAALNDHLPPQIRILRCQFMPAHFHARFSATGKEYQYRIANTPTFHPFELGRAAHVPRPLDLDALRAAAAHLVGEHDFASFTSNPGYKRPSTVRHIYKITVTRQSGLVTLRFVGSGFLYRMVRNIVGALIKVGHGKLTPQDIHTILQARSRPAAPNTAPACGLYLKKVFYRGLPKAPYTQTSNPGYTAQANT